MTPQQTFDKLVMWTRKVAQNHGEPEYIVYFTSFNIHTILKPNGDASTLDRDFLETFNPQCIHFYPGETHIGF